MSIIIKKALLNNRKKDVYIEDNKITEINDNIKIEAEHKINAENKALMPSFFNGHTHAAMTLFRGYGDDMLLQEWLEQKIWPLEAKLTEKDVYLGSKLACLEMIKSGTTFFNDMYWQFHGTARAVEESGIRSAVSEVFIDLFDENKAKEQIKLNKRLFEECKKYSNRVRFALGPHAIYTVSEESLKWVKEFADKHKLLIHMHISETEREVKDCLKQHKKRPMEYLNDIGFLGSNLIACHSIWLNDREIELLAKHDVKVVYNPISNLKLASGYNFRYKDMMNKGLKLCIGSDGCASNNNLDMLEEIKFAALIQKAVNNDPTVLPVKESFNMITKNSAEIFKINAGLVKEGKLADLVLVNTKLPELIPSHDFISDLVYAANGYCVDTTICDGKILMHNRKVNGEEEIMEKAKEIAYDLINR